MTSSPRAGLAAGLAALGLLGGLKVWEGRQAASARAA